MRTIATILFAIVWVIFLPFYLISKLIDYIFIDYWKQRAANKWRQQIKPGDRAYFINLLGTKTYGTVTRVFGDGEARLEFSNGSGPYKITNLYPAKDEDE